MRIISIDPGFDRLGLAIIEKIKGKEELVFSCCLQTDRKNTISQRLAQLENEILELCNKYEPDEAAIEKLFFSKNQKTALGVAEARGMILSLLGTKKIPIREFTPNQIKLATTGYGSADKKQVAMMVRKLIKIDHPVLHDDELDAIAIGLTALASIKSIST